MRVAVKHSVAVWAEVDLKEKKVDRVIVDDGDVSRPIEYRVVLEDGIYDPTRYAGRKMARATRHVLDTEAWPSWEIGFG